MDLDSKQMRVEVSCSTLIVLLVLLVPSIAFPITMIGIGASHLYECPVQPYIPIWLIVAGSVAVFVLIVADVIIFYSIRTGFNLVTDIYKNNQNYFKTWRFLYSFVIIVSVFTLLASLFLLAWFIVGNVWVYKSYSAVQFMNPFSISYCQKTTYELAFWSIIVFYILLLVLALLAISFVCVTLNPFSSLLKMFKTQHSNKQVITARV